MPNKLNLQPYDPRWGKVYSEGQDIPKGKKVGDARFPMKWGRGVFLYQDVDRDNEIFIFKTKKRTLVLSGTKDSAILWKQYLNPGKYSGEKLREIRRKRCKECFDGVFMMEPI